MKKKRNYKIKSWTKIRFENGFEIKQMMKRRKQIKVIMKRKKNTNKKISNNEPLERRTEFERTRERIETAASSKEKETVRRR